ncbi:DMT family transporter [Gemmatimonadota bacterium]
MTRTCALCGVFIISFSAIFVRLAGVSPSTSAFYRMAYALPVLILLAYLSRREDTRQLKYRLMAIGSGLMLSLDLCVWHWSIDLIGAGLATVIANIQVVFVGLISWRVLGEKPTRMALMIIPVVFLGAAISSGLGGGDAYGSDPILGTSLSFLTAILYAGFLVLFRASNRDGVNPAGPLRDVTLGAVAGTMFIGLLDPGFSFIPVWPAHGWLLALALLPHTVGWLLISRALPRLPGLETSVLLLMQPVLTVIWGLLIFAESLSPVQWAGVIIVLGGIGFLSVSGGVVRPVEIPSE